MRCYQLDRIRTSNGGERIMAIVCDICSEEVEIISFGTGFVGVCCNEVLYNDEDKPQFELSRSRRKILPWPGSVDDGSFIKQKIPDRVGCAGTQRTIFIRCRRADK